MGEDHPWIVVGAGGAGKVDTANRCLKAGADFLTSDGLHPSVVEFAAQHEVVVVPGALTPTEVMAAWEARSDYAKVVPST